MSNRIRVAIASAVIVFMLGSFCVGAASRELKIGLVVKAAANPFWLELKAGAEQAAKESGVKLIYMAPVKETDVAEQLKMVEDLIQMRVDGIVIAPNDPWAVVPAIEQAQKAGIPVVTVDTASSTLVESVCVQTDNVKGGRIAGEYVAKVLGGEGQVAVIATILGVQIGRDRFNGFCEALNPYEDIAVVSVQQGYCERPRAMAVTENILQAHPNVDAIFSANDEQVFGVMQAVQGAAKLNKIVTVGFDGVQEALREIKAGRLTATIKQFPDRMGYIGVNTVVELIANPDKSFPKIIDTGVELITLDNVDKYLN
jgi:ribose transport system substrate-binding protein